MDVNLVGQFWGMPFNSTGQISDQAGLLSNTGLFTVLGVFIGWLLNVSTSAIQEKQRLNAERIKEKKQAYSNLLGIKASVHQNYTTLTSLLTRYYWLKARKRLNLPPIDDYGKVVDYENKVCDSELELARCMQRYWEIIGQIEVSFFAKQELEEKIKAITSGIDCFSSINCEIMEDFQKRGIDELDSFEANPESEKLHEIVDGKINEPLRILADYLKQEINVELTSWHEMRIDADEAGAYY